MRPNLTSAAAEFGRLFKKVSSQASAKIILKKKNMNNSYHNSSRIRKLFASCQWPYIMLLQELYVNFSFTFAS